MIEYRVALAAHRLMLAAVALCAPRAAGRLYGLDFETHTAGAELTRLMAARNLALGLGLIVADPGAQPLMGKLNVLVDVVDVVTVADETRRRALPFRASVIGMLTAAVAAAFGSLMVRGSGPR